MLRKSVVLGALMAVLLLACRPPSHEEPRQGLSSEVRRAGAAVQRFGVHSYVLEEQDDTQRLHLHDAGDRLLGIMEVTTSPKALTIRLGWKGRNWSFANTPEGMVIYKEGQSRPLTAPSPAAASVTTKQLLRESQEELALSEALICDAQLLERARLGQSMEATPQRRACTGLWHRSEVSANVLAPVRLLAELKLGPEHKVRFESNDSRWISIVEEGAQDTARLVTPELARQDVLTIWTSLTNGGAAPDELVRASQELHADSSAAPVLSATLSSAPVPKEPLEPAHGEGGYPTLASEQTWFRDKFCGRTVRSRCVQGWNWAFSGTTDNSSDRFYSVGMVGREGTTPATLTEDFWACSATCFLWWCWDWNCDWQRMASDSISPGYWRGRTFVGGDGLSLTEGTTFRSRLGDAGTSTQISLLAQWEPWTPSTPPPGPPPPPAPRPGFKALLISNVNNADSITLWQVAPSLQMKGTLGPLTYAQFDLVDGAVNVINGISHNLVNDYNRTHGTTLSPTDPAAASLVNVIRSTVTAEGNSSGPVGAASMGY